MRFEDQIEGDAGLKSMRLIPLVFGDGDDVSVLHVFDQFFELYIICLSESRNFFSSVQVFHDEFHQCTIVSSEVEVRMACSVPPVAHGLSVPASPRMASTCRRAIMCTVC